MLLVELIVIALVSYRIWRLAAEDTLTESIRDRLPTSVYHFLSCGWCAGSWVTFGVTAGAWGLGWVTNPWLVGIGAASLVGWAGEH